MENVIKNKNLWFPKKTIQDMKKIFTQNCSPEKDIQIYFGTLIGHIVFVLIVKNVIKDKKI